MKRLESDLKNVNMKVDELLNKLDEPENRELKSKLEDKGFMEIIYELKEYSKGW